MKQNIPAKKYPLVSVIIPTINSRKRELERALRSVAKQTYKYIELIIVNEGLSAPAQRNIGILRAKGAYCAFLDDDDEWEKHKIEMQVEYMEKHKSCGLCLSWAHDKRFGMNRVSMPKEDLTFDDLIKSFNLSSTSSYMARRKIFKLGLHFNKKLASGQEYDLALQIAHLRWDIHTIQRILMRQNSTDGQISTNWKKKITGQMQFYVRWHEFFSIMGYVKFVGLLGLFTMGFVVDVKIYKLINYIKEMYEK